MHLKVKKQCILSRSVAYVITNFSGQFSKIYTSVLVNQVFMLKINFTTVSFKSNTKFSVILM